MASPASLSRPRQLKRTGIPGSAKETFRKQASSASPAGFIKGVWKGPLTFRGMQRLAPLSLARAAAFSTAALSPPRTSWPGQL